MRGMFWRRDSPCIIIIITAATMPPARRFLRIGLVGQSYILDPTVTLHSAVITSPSLLFRIDGNFSTLTTLLCNDFAAERDRPGEIRALPILSSSDIYISTLPLYFMTYYLRKEEDKISDKITSLTP